MEEKKRLTAVKRSDTELDLRNVMLEKKAHNNILGTEDTQSDSLEMDFNKKSVKKGGNLDSAVVIRLIRDEKDIEATWPLYLSFHKESRYKNLPAETAEKTRRLEIVRKHFLQNPKQYGMFIAEINGKPIGFLHCVMSQLSIYQISVIFGFGILCVAILSGYLARRACRIEIVACLSCLGKATPSGGNTGSCYAWF